MPGTNYNERLPDLQNPGQYPYIQFHQYRDGSWTRHDETPYNESHAHGHITGSYKETDLTGSHKHLQVAFLHNYTTQGKSTTLELNHDEKIGASQVHRTQNDHYKEIGNNNMHAVGKHTVHASGDSHFIHATSGTSITSEEDHSTDHGSSHNVNIQGDHVNFINGVHYQYVGSDQGTYLPNGNKDVNVSQKYNMQSSTQITLKVGSSIVTILPNKITIVDGNGNQVYMDGSKMYIEPEGQNILYLGGDGSNGSYDYIVTLSGPSINTKARYS